MGRRPNMNSTMHDFARPNVRSDGSPAACALPANRLGSPRPKLPSAPTRSHSRRVTPSQVRIGEPGMDNITVSLAGAVDDANVTI